MVHKTLNYLVILFIAVLIGSCATGKLTPVLKSDLAAINIDNCSFIDGSYQSEGTKVVYPASPRHYNKNVHLEDMFAFEDIAHAENSIDISIQYLPLRIHVLVKNNVGKIIGERVLKSKISNSRIKNNIYCTNRGIILESSVKGSSVGSSVLYTSTKTEYYLSNEGNLEINRALYIETRSWFVFKNEKTYVINYNFNRL